ncbi:MAG: hypothetical protein JJE35_00205 [Thermoleophilia bacterium]|nr:hypothetical protein [Thermoleophilia bacterium]
MSPRTEFELVLSDSAIVYARLDTEHGEATRYAVTLVAEENGELRTVRVYDNAHGEPEMHRYSLDGEKQPAEKLPGATPSEGFNMALDLIMSGYTEMIDGWRRG